MTSAPKLSVKNALLLSCALGLMTGMAPILAFAHEQPPAAATNADAAQSAADGAAQTTTAKKEEVQVTVQQIGENIHIIQGQGGNIAVLSGNDGAVMIDADFAEVTPTITKAVQSFTNKPIKFLVNTHWHGDHTGGNGLIGAAGSSIIAHDTVRPRLSVDNYIAAFDLKMPAQPAAGLPNITFNDTITLHMNGEQMRLIHVPPAHTDGDIIIHFPKANIIHTGDVYFNGFYPFIDSSTGGNLAGMIAAADRILALCDENTKIIPGHGPLSGKAELQAYRDMLAAVESKLKPMIDAGQTIEQITATQPLAEFNTVWGDGFIPSEKWLPIAIEAIKPSNGRSVEKQ